MGKTVVLFGSSTGNTESAARIIATKLNADIINIADKPIDKIAEYQNLVLGTSTWGLGDLQDDWDSFLPQLAKADLSGKTVALFGLGDASSYPDTFVDGIGLIYEAIRMKDCKFIGFTDIKDYSFSDSRALHNGSFVGLPLDEDNDSNKTNERIEKWIDELKTAL